MLKSAIIYDLIFRLLGVNFFPFIGKKYFFSYPKILILGESHYFPKSIEIKDFQKWDKDHYRTREVIADDDNEGYINTAALIAMDKKDNKWIWDYVSFYNFFQKHVGHGNNKNILYSNYDRMIMEAQKSIIRIIKILRPNLIIAWGTSYLFNSWMPQFIESEKIDKEIEKLYRYKKLKKTAIWHIHHPSRSFDLDKWSNEFKKVNNILNLPELRKTYKQPISK